MLITFKSRADGDVIMFGTVGKQMLETLGKDPEEPRGIITLDQLPAAISALQEAISRDKAAHAKHEEEDEWVMTQEEIQARKEAHANPEVSFAQRAAPLLQLLEYSLADKTSVIWEV